MPRELFAIVVHGTSAILGTLLIANYGGDPKVPLYAPLVEFMSSSQNRGALYVPKPMHIFNCRVFLPAVLFEWLTMAAHVVYLSVEFLSPNNRVRLFRIASGRKYTAKDGTVTWEVSHAYNPLRFYEYAVTATIMQVGGMVALGITDFYFFVLSIVANVALQVVGYILEIMDRDSLSHQRIAAILLNMFTLITFAQLFALFMQMFASQTHHLSVFLWNLIPNFILWQSFGLVARSNFYKKGPFEDALFTEKAYMALSIITKLSLFWLQFATYHEIAESLGTVPVVGVNWAAIRWFSGFGLSGLLVLYGGTEWWIYDREKQSRLREFTSMPSHTVKKAAPLVVTLEKPVTQRASVRNNGFVRL